MKKWLGIFFIGVITLLCLLLTVGIGIPFFVVAGIIFAIFVGFLANYLYKKCMPRDGIENAMVCMDISEVPHGMIDADTRLLRIERVDKDGIVKATDIVTNERVSYAQVTSVARPKGDDRSNENDEERATRRIR